MLDWYRRINLVVWAARAFRVHQQHERLRPPVGQLPRLPDPKSSPGQRALDLFMSHLSPEQAEQIAKNKTWFIANGSRGTRFIISTVSGSMNVFRLDKKGRIADIQCVHSKWHSAIPRFDEILLQKVMIEANEKLYLDTATRHTGDTTIRIAYAHGFNPYAIY